MSIEKNDVLEGVAEAYGTDGEGIIKCGGTTFFVPFCIPGERVRFSAVSVKGKAAYGKAAEILSPSPHRVSAPCPIAFGKCGGCVLQHMDYGEQLRFKRELVQNTLGKLGGIYAPVDEVVSCALPYRYRNKLALPIGVDRFGNTVVGFFAPRSHRIVPIADCLIQAPWVKKIISAITAYIGASGLKGYDSLKCTGELRQIVVREVGGKYIIALVAARNVDVSFLEDRLAEDFGDFTLLLNINNSDGNAVFSDKWRICCGEGFFESEENGIKYAAGANTFLQVNNDVRSKLYARVLEEAEGEAAIDLYSGGGMLTAMLALKCGKAYGVEVVPEASRCAEELKEKNGLNGRMINICGKVEDKLAEALYETRDKSRVIVCDPPRKGMERRVVEAVRDSGVKKIILVSCNPATLARDLGVLTGTLRADEKGALVRVGDMSASPYVITSITPFDMFPQTRHVETLVVLQRK